MACSRQRSQTFYSKIVISTTECYETQNIFFLVNDTVVEVFMTFNQSGSLTS